jgi:hypothetical protein
MLGFDGSAAGEVPQINIETKMIAGSMNLVIVTGLPGL